MEDNVDNVERLRVGGVGEENEGGNQGGDMRGEDGNSPLVDAKGAAKLLMISDSMFYKMNKQGKTPPPVMVGNLLRWNRKVLLEWIANGCLPVGKTANKHVTKYTDEP